MGTLVWIGVRKGYLGEETGIQNKETLRVEKLWQKTEVYGFCIVICKADVQKKEFIGATVCIRRFCSEWDGCNTPLQSTFLAPFYTILLCSAVKEIHNEEGWVFYRKEPFVGCLLTEIMPCIIYKSLVIHDR